MELFDDKLSEATGFVVQDFVSFRSLPYAALTLFQMLTTSNWHGMTLHCARGREFLTLTRNSVRRY